MGIYFLILLLANLFYSLNFLVEIFGLLNFFQKMICQVSLQGRKLLATILITLVNITPFDIQSFLYCGVVLKSTFCIFWIKKYALKLFWEVKEMVFTNNLGIDLKFVKWRDYFFHHVLLLTNKEAWEKLFDKKVLKKTLEPPKTIFQSKFILLPKFDFNPINSFFLKNLLQNYILFILTLLKS